MDESPSPDLAGNEPNAAGTEPADTTGEGGSSAAGSTGAPGTGSEWRSAGWHVRDDGPRDWVAQLQGMIDSIAEQAAPVLREVAAKAAELAAVAADNAGPALHRAGDVATDVGQKVAVRTKEYAAELRRQQAEHAEQPPTSETPSQDGEEPPA